VAPRPAALRLQLGLQRVSRQDLASWYQHDFAQRVASFAHGNPWPPVHGFLQDVVLTHAAFFVGISAAGETAAVVLLLFPTTTRLGGAVAALVGLSYSLSMDWVNLGHAVHNGSFAVLGLLFLALGGWLPLTRRLGARLLVVVLGILGLLLAYPMAFRWEGVLPALPWAVAAPALLVHGIAMDRRLPTRSNLDHLGGVA
jgi:hypothetical protein